jgi:tRNA A-37 threonylcarbamoyl transferase component Bud32/tetratricopeptide (TPR) repeat protein
MNGPENSQENVERLWQEAEVYESHGLHDQAVLVYQHILSKDPNNRKAQAKVVQIQFTQRMEQTPSGRRIASDEPSAQLSVDLGLAYMGLNLYEDALDAFTEALGVSSGQMPELWRHVATALVGLYNTHSDVKVFEDVISSPLLTMKAKGEVVSQAIEMCLEQQGPHSASRLLASLPKEIRKLVKNYKVILEQVDSSGLDHGDESRTMSGPWADDNGFAAAETTNPVTGSSRAAQDMETSIPLNVRIRYSFDNKHWLNGMASRLSADWALIHLTEAPVTGDLLVIQLHLPRQKDNEPVWALARIANIFSENQPTLTDFPITTKADFTTFLPGGEAMLKSFIDEVVNDPDILTETGKNEVEGFTERAAAMFDTLHEEASKALGDAFIPESAGNVDLKPYGDISLLASVALEDNRAEPSQNDPKKVRFACSCGQVHVIGIQNVGRKGKCKKCGLPLKVPLIDFRPDRISEQLTGKIIGGCRLLYKIGGGGMGGVFKAHHVGLDIPVAVKILYSHLAAEDSLFIRRFIREARSAAKLRHPNIVGVMNVGYENGLHYLIMPFVEGGSAAVLLARSGPLPIDRVLEIGIDIATALSVAEEHNLLHRDVKPANILFGSRGEAMLADLGLAKTSRDSTDLAITQSGIACGTPLYFSPEQAKGVRKLDIRSDIYSLGITLYHLINGTPPFIGDSPFVVFQKHVNEPLPAFKQMDTPVPDSVFEFIKKMTAKNPDERFANSQELLSGLEDLKKRLSAKKKPASVPKKKTLLGKLGFKSD